MVTGLRVAEGRYLEKTKRWLSYKTDDKKPNREHLTERILLPFHMQSCSRSLSILFPFCICSISVLHPLCTVLFPFHSVILADLSVELANNTVTKVNQNNKVCFVSFHAETFQSQSNSTHPSISLFGYNLGLLTITKWLWTRRCLLNACKKK